MKASNMIMSCAMEGNEQASVRGFVMVLHLKDEDTHIYDDLYHMFVVMIVALMIYFAGE